MSNLLSNFLNSLKKQIQHIYDDSNQNYGAPKITKELRKSGECISQRTVGKYMRKMGIKAQWVKPWTTDGFVYLNCIMDLYSRKIIAWTLADTLEVSTVISTIDKAKSSRDTDMPLIIHSNCGCQYVSEAWRQATEGMTRSYSHTGYPYDNACIESFHSLIKREWLNLSFYFVLNLDTGPNVLTHISHISSFSHFFNHMIILSRCFSYYLLHTFIFGLTASYTDAAINLGYSEFSLVRPISSSSTLLDTDMVPPVLHEYNYSLYSIVLNYQPSNQSLVESIAYITGRNIIISCNGEPFTKKLYINMIARLAILTYIPILLL